MIYGANDAGILSFKNNIHEWCFASLHVFFFKKKE